MEKKKKEYFITADLLFEEDYKGHKCGDFVRDFRFGYFSDSPFLVALEECLSHVDDLFDGCVSISVTRFVLFHENG